MHAADQLWWCHMLAARTSYTLVLLLHIALRNAGVLESLPMVLLQFAQQHQQPARGCMNTFRRTCAMMTMCLMLWGRMLRPKATVQGDYTAATAAAAVPVVVPLALPLLQQLQRCAPLLLSKRPQTGYDNSQIQKMHVAYHALQEAAGKFVCSCSQLADGTASGSVPQLPVEAVQQLRQVLRDPAVCGLLLQLLAANTMLLHQQHTEHLQQQLSQLQGSSSSSSSLRNQQQPEQQQLQQPVQSCKQHRADLLRIPAFHQHQDMLQLLPGGQTYPDAAAARAILEAAETLPNSCRQLASMQAATLRAVCVSLTASKQFTTVVPALSAAAVRMVLELQLLAAGGMQRQQQQHGSSGQQAAGPPDVLLLHSNALLQAQISALAQAGSNGVLA
jgi:hypothetical protein